MDNADMYFKTPEELATFAREKRQELGWSQKELAEKVGVNRWWIMDFERGKPTVEFRLVLKTLEALELNLFIEEETGKDEIDLNDVLNGNFDDDDEL